MILTDIEASINCLTQEIISLQRRITSLKYEHITDVDRHDDDLDALQKLVPRIRSIRQDLENLL